MRGLRLCPRRAGHWLPPAASFRSLQCQRQTCAEQLLAASPFFFRSAHPFITVRLQPSNRPAEGPHPISTPSLQDVDFEEEELIEDGYESDEPEEKEEEAAAGTSEEGPASAALTGSEGEEAGSDEGGQGLGCPWGWATAVGWLVHSRHAREQCATLWQ